MPLRYISVRLLLAIAVFAAAALASLAGSAAAAPNKPYTVVVESPVTAGATDPAYTVTLTNNAKQTLGSANLAVPSEFAIADEPPSITPSGTVSRAGNVLQLRNLSLASDASVTVTLGLRFPCAADDYPWTVVAKQSNDFNGTGNDFGPVSGTLSTKVTGTSGTAGLRFVNQPASAERNAQIRSVDFQPASAPVTVEALNACGRRDTSFTGTIELRLLQSGPGVLTPNPASSTAVAGLASFSNLSINQSGNYNLRATTPVSGFEPAESEDFQVIGVVEPCSGSSCTATLAGTNTTSTLTGGAGSGTGFALLSLNLGTKPVCAGYTPPTPDYYEFGLTVPRDKTITATYSKAAVMAFGKPVSALQICFAAPIPFQAKTGPAQPFDYDGDPTTGPGGKEGFVGLLPNCPVSPAGPCITKRQPLGGDDDDDHRHGGSSGGGAIVKFFVPAAWGDPRYH